MSYNTASFLFWTMDRCLACLDRPRQVLLLACGHSPLCSACLAQLLEHGQPCPACRTPILEGDWQLLEPNEAPLQPVYAPSAVDAAAAARVADAAAARAEASELAKPWESRREGLALLAAACSGERTSLRLHGEPGLGALGAFALATTLSAPTSSLLTLELDVCAVGDEGALALAHALSTNETLQRLSLRQCGISDTGAIMLGATLTSNEALLALLLDDNALTENGAAGLAAGLNTNATLKLLSLAGNAINDVGAALLSSALDGRETTLELDLRDCHVSDATSATLSAAFPSIWRFGER